MLVGGTGFWGGGGGGVGTFWWGEEGLQGVFRYIKIVGKQS